MVSLIILSENDFEGDFKVKFCEIILLLLAGTKTVLKEA